MAETECKTCGRGRLEFRIDCGPGLQAEIVWIAGEPAAGVRIVVDGADRTQALKGIAVALIGELDRQLAALAAAEPVGQLVQLGGV